MTTPESLLRVEAVLQRVGLSRSALYARVQVGTFPAPINIPGSRSVAWPSSEIDRWVHAQIAAARAAQGGAGR